MCENGFSQKIKKLQVLKKMLQFNEKVDIKGEDNIIQYRVTAKVKVSEDKKLNSGNEQGNKKHWPVVQHDVNRRKNVVA